MATKCEDVQMPFGKHRGKRLGDILDEDPTYLDWLNDADWLTSDHLRAAILEMNKKYASRIEAAIEQSH